MAFSELQWGDATFEVLEFAHEDDFGLVEIRNQWPRELIVAVLSDLVQRGLIVIGRHDELGAASAVDAAEVASVLADQRTWEPSREDWVSGAYVSVIATDAGEREYDRLVTERLGL